MLPRCYRFSIASLFVMILFSISEAAAARKPAPLLNKQELLNAQTFWDNRDWNWYKANIPFLDTPDPDINTTYYYRWELITKHLVYASPETGYTFTEFMDRPGWSGRYGSISCAAGHQLNEVRWLKNPIYAQDYCRYWQQTPGAQPRRYSTWLADAAWSLYEVQGDRAFTVGLQKGLIDNYQGWVREHFVPAVGMFWQTGTSDGMESNINSRQTADSFGGAPGYRPTLNSYMYADARAISNIASLMGDEASAKQYESAAADLKKRVQQMLWDPKREFFLHMFQHDERGGIKALTRTYETGPYAGSSHGREEIGFVPWEFNLPDQGYETGWKFLMDPDYFYAPYGPTTVERHDPLFVISPNCCVWSGQSWPYATTQTLKAMANLLNNYVQSYVNKDDYFKLLKVYTLTQRKDGQPYIAESANPDTGSWKGSDTFDHSENYFHSGYNDLIISGLIGLRPRADDTLEVNPLVPGEWGYFALDDLGYHGHRISVLWDRTGSRYHRGAGLRLFVDGKQAASAPTLRRLTAHLSPALPPVPAPRLLNYAVNNDGTYFPHFTASDTYSGTPLNNINDGNYWYTSLPPNRWTCYQSPHHSDWVAVDFGVPRPVKVVKAYLLDDGPGSGIQAPSHMELQYSLKGKWKRVPGQTQRPRIPEGHRPSILSFPTVVTEKLRLVLTHRPGAASGLSEFEAWGPGTLPLPPPTAPVDDLAYNPTATGFPMASASFTSRFDRVAEVNDGKIFFSAGSRNRWTAYESPNKSDWVEIDFGAPKRVGSVKLYIFGDGGGVQAPVSYRIQYWNGADWLDAAGQVKTPPAPTAGAENTVDISPVTTSRIRVVLTHLRGSFSGLTEMEVFGP